MKIISTVAAIIFAFTFCTASCVKGKDSLPTQNNDSSTPSTTKMKITIGTAVFFATLYDNPSANAFRAKFPITLKMTELNSNEKYFDLPGNLPTNASVGGAIKAGELNLYGNNTLVLFYKSFYTSYSYTKLGYVDDPTGLAAALGTGEIVVKFENN
ncbi:cyclophilin-like fold protein [Pedobacter aquatilis]|uniref:cyclophilin-like fold protein n=1 Tax=Pedobacter aquatilis TaxID=351343 RepID=UPI0025B53ABC|nr:cyclophilin-like fold protein [Pedobacter aquatilis]MDN3585040.1 cyclophilin-like fold protein [Pedobacter aquatilis]